MASWQWFVAGMACTLGLEILAGVAFLIWGLFDWRRFGMP
jgi:hypothetical protein